MKMFKISMSLYYFEDDIVYNLNNSIKTDRKMTNLALQLVLHAI